MENLKFEADIGNGNDRSIMEVLNQAYFKMINRKYNSEADGLAKNGIRKARLEEEWY